MNFSLFLKVFCDLCLYFSVLSGFPTLFPCRISFLWPVFLCSIGAGIGSGLYRHWGKFGRAPGILLSLLPLALIRCPADAMVLFPALVYTLFAVFRSVCTPEYDSSRDFAKGAFAAWVFFYLVLLLIRVFEKMANPMRSFLNAWAPLGYGLMAFAACVLLLRMLRMESSQQAHAQNRRQMLLTACGMGGALLCAVGLETAARRYASSLSGMLQYVFTRIVSILLYPINRIVEMIRDQKDMAQFQEQVNAATQETYATSPMPTGTITGIIPQPELPGEPGYAWWAALLLLVLLAIVLFLMLRLLHHHPEETVRPDTASPIPPAVPRKEDSPRSSRSKVRRIYREFLRRQRKAGVQIRRNHTSLDVLNRISPQTDPEAAKALRTVYLSARYDETREVTPDQLRAAQNALKKSTEKR